MTAQLAPTAGGRVGKRSVMIVAVEVEVETETVERGMASSLLCKATGAKVGESGFDGRGMGKGKNESKKEGKHQGELKNVE